MLELSYIIERTRSFINELSGEETDDFSEETDLLLAAHADAAVKSVASVVPVRFLTVTEQTLLPTKTERPDGRGVLTVNVPTDCMRLQKLVSPELKRPITSFLTNLDARYSMEWCEVPGIGSGAANPSAYVWSGKDGETIEIHSVEDVRMRGDMNKDRVLDVSDVIQLDSFLLSPSTDKDTKWRADVNGDGEVNVSDKVELNRKILAGEVNDKVKLHYVAIPKLHVEKEYAEDGTTLVSEKEGYSVDGELLNAVSYTAGALYLRSVGSELAAGALEAARMALDAVGAVQMPVAGEN